MNNKQLNYSQLENELMETKCNLDEMTLKANDYQEQKLELEQSLVEAKQYTADLEASLHDIQNDSQTDVIGATGGSVVTVDASILSELEQSKLLVATMTNRLREVEKSTLQAKQNIDVTQTKTAQSHRHLETELSRTKQLVDHLRTVNIKLMDDIKSSHLSTMQVKSLEHRLNVSREREVSMAEQISQLEIAIRTREADALDQQQQKLNIESEWASKYDTLSNDLNNDIQSLTSQLSTTKRELQTIKSEYSENISQVSRDNERYSTQIEELNKELKLTNEYLQHDRHELESAQDTVSNNKILIEDLETRVDNLTNDLKAREEESQKTVERLNDEVKVHFDRGLCLEKEVEALKISVREKQKQLLMHESELVSQA